MKLTKDKTYFFIPPGCDFVVPVKVAEIQKEKGWVIEAYWFDEPVGHASYEGNLYDVYFTLAGALSGLRSKRKEIEKQEGPKWQKKRYKSLNGWRTRMINSLKRQWKQGEWPTYKPKPIYR